MPETTKLRAPTPGGHDDTAKMPTLRVLGSATFLALMLISYVVGYYNGSIDRAPVVHFGPDAEDIRFVARPGTGTYDPDFTHVNTIPSKTR